MTVNRKYRVLIVDDSAVVRETLSALIGKHPELEVMAKASDPFEAARFIKSELPDVITLDVEMPKMDGITFLRRLMAQKPLPVVVCSSLVGEGSKTLMAALDAGAVDIIKKPSIGTRKGLEEAAIQIQDKVLGAAKAKLSRNLVHQRAMPNSDKPQTESTRIHSAMHQTTQTIVAVGASTGGTEALRYVLSALPSYSPPIVIVQHMPEHFTAAFAERLNQECNITVREAKDGDRVLRGQALIAPGRYHISLNRSGAEYIIRVVDGPLVSRHRPSVNVLFRSVAKFAGANAIGVIMTGMGDDGAEGLRAMRLAGARTIGQNENSCVVYGMSRIANQIGAVETEVDLAQIPDLISNLGQEKVA